MGNPVTDRARPTVSLPTIPRQPSWFAVAFAVGVAFSAVDVLQTYANWWMEASPIWLTLGFEAFLVFTVVEIIVYAALWRAVRSTRWRRAFLAYVAVWALWQAAVPLWNIAALNHLV